MKQLRNWKLGFYFQNIEVQVALNTQLKSFSKSSEIPTHHGLFSVMAPRK